MNRWLAHTILPQIRDLMTLHHVAEIIEETGNDLTTLMAEGRLKTAHMARFKAEVVTARFEPRRQIFDQEDYLVHSSSDPYSLGTSIRSQETVFVEWLSFRSQTNQPSRGAEEQIHELGCFLAVPDRPQDFSCFRLCRLVQRQSQYTVRNGIPIACSSA